MHTYAVRLHSLCTIIGTTLEMETRFQTSFIPKKPIVTNESSGVKVHHSVSILLIVSILIFIASLGAAAFTVFWKGYLLQMQTQYENTLQTNESQFNPALITTLKRFNTKIDFAKKLINNHLAMSEVFDIIAQLTAQNISFDKFDYTAPTDSTGIKLSMTGVASSFSDIAFQSDVFGQSAQYGTNQVIKNPVLSGLTLNSDGTISFTFTSALDPSDVSYTKVLQSSLGGVSTTTQ